MFLNHKRTRVQEQGKKKKKMSGTKGDAIVTPGTKLGKTRDFASGPGSYVRGDFIYASLLGKKELVPAPAEGGKATIQVVSRAGNAAGTATAPTIGSVATVKITKINQKFATASIICVGDVPLKEPFAGIIRYQDVRPTEIDTVEISKCFRPGDVVRAEVVS